MVRIILRKDIENLGDVGDIVDVKPGYARNYLLPQGSAGCGWIRNGTR